MIQIELVDQLPDLEWSDQALFELDRHGTGFLTKASSIYRLGDFGVLGLNYSSFLSAPWLWFMLAKNIVWQDLKDLRAQVHRVPSGTLTVVEDGYTVGERFARFFGFQPTGNSYEIGGLAYNEFRRI
jgi:hypothetical protein